MLYGKRCGFIIFYLVCFGWGFADEVILAVGDSTEQVVDVLGAPEGRIELEAETVWLFEAGKVWIKDGAVSRLKWLNEDERAQLNQDRVKSAQAHALYEEARAERIQKGEALKIRQLSNRAFLSQSKEGQLRYWKSFQQSYPGVDVSRLISGLHREIEERRQERARLAASKPTARTTSRKWCHRHGYSCGYRYAVHGCSPYGRPVQPSQNTGITEFKDEEMRHITPGLNGLPSGRIRSTLGPRPSPTPRQ